MKRATQSIRSGLPSRVLIIGSGALRIGQAGEFDYSGSQALKALREEGVETVLLNPNIATVQTSEEMAGAVYFLPIDPQFVEQVIVKERIDAVLLSFGGQTALNCGLALDASGVLARHGVRVLGTPVESIRAAEDRQIFADKMREIGVSVARSIAARSSEEAMRAVKEIGLPVILRAGFSLGGQGSAIVRSESDLRAAVDKAFAGSGQVLVEECVFGWKEIEYEVVRDGSNNCITVCNMENLDPMGVHTGESIVVAPSQTLSDADYQMLRNLSIRIVRHLGIVGECNVQYALDMHSSEYRVIEVNPRLSRSSALASKATGYPLAYIAAKIALGYDLPMLSNAVTRTTTAFFEPALDYVVCKVPRWDFDKFAGVDNRIGTEMKSVGEVMAVGRSFQEVIQKALRMLELGVDGLDPGAFRFPDLRRELREPSPRRIFAVAQAFDAGMSMGEVAELTAINPFFLSEIQSIVATRRRLAEIRGAGEVDRVTMVDAKRSGFSDLAIARCVCAETDDVRRRRLELGVRPHLAQIDTLAAEYPADTNYLYWTYWADADDVAPSAKPAVLILGSGCYRIGSSVEFDWSSVNAALESRKLGFRTVLLNCNPETVSTDYDMCDVLIFDEVSLESVLELCDVLPNDGIFVSMGGQTPNNLALKLHRAGRMILGTPPESIDRAEDRKKFSALCDELGIDQPRWFEARSLKDLERSVELVGGFPVVVRPSYVLSGAAMRVAHGISELREYVGTATDLSPEHPVVISKFESHAREIEFDGVAKDGRMALWSIVEHVEFAGVHSGDATLVLPPQELSVATIRTIRRAAARIAKELRVTGPLNIQFLARDNQVKVIECNLRASRSFPFVSKVLGVNFISEATRLMLGGTISDVVQPVSIFDLGFVAVKSPQFSFGRLSGADPVLGIEMASTGEVACMGDDEDEALLKSMLATGFRMPSKGVLLSLGPVGDKYLFTEAARTLRDLGLVLYATPGTAEVLRSEGVECCALDPNPDAGGSAPMDAVDAMRRGLIDFVINVPRQFDERGRPDGYRIRRAAIDLQIPLVTDLCVARKLVRAIARCGMAGLRVRSMAEYLALNGNR